MKKREFKTDRGTILYIPYDNKDRPYCPVCGDRLDGITPYYGDNMPSYDMCSSCGLHFGHNETPGEFEQGVSQEDHLALRRKKWLDNTGWRQEDIDQLRDVLDINAEDLRSDK